jgi:arylsulfatase A-like enzyme
MDFRWMPSALAAGLALACAKPARPHVLLISLDSVRADALTFRDDVAAPNMAALARSGCVFENAFSGASWTLPAHAQMFTGTSPLMHGVQSDDVRLDENMPTLPEILRSAGYRTLGFFTARYLWADYGFGRGFDLYQSAMTQDDVDRGGPSFAPRGAEAFARGTQLLESEYVSSENIVELAERALEDVDSDQPVFLFAHFFDPHYDYVPPPPYESLFDPDYEGDLDGRGYWHNPRIWDESKSPPRQVGERDLDHLVSLYRGEIAWTDAAVGELIALFERSGRLDETLVIITADHGEEFFEHGRRGHRQSLFDEVLRVPLLVVPPASQRAGLAPRIQTQVSLSDLLPTVLDYAGVEPPQSACGGDCPDVCGRSLRTGMEGHPIAERPLLASLYTWKSSGGAVRHSLLHGLRTSRFKFLRHARIGEAGVLRVHEALYYDLLSDPRERNPIRDPADERVRSAWLQMEQQLERLREHWRDRTWSSASERSTDVSRTFMEELVALGYADSAEGANQPALELPWGLAPPPRLDPP